MTVWKHFHFGREQGASMACADWGVLWRSAMTLLPTLLQSDHRYLPEASALLVCFWSLCRTSGMVGEQAESIEMLVGQGRLPGSLVGLGKKSPKRTRKRQGGGCAPGLPQEESEGFRSPPFQTQKQKGLCNCFVAERSPGRC